MKSTNKKRKKSSRFSGSHTHGRGFKKKARGSGHRGGFGMAGTGKRADQKKTLILNLPYEYFGKEGLKPKKERYKIVNVGDLERIANGKKELELNEYKILSKGDIKIALNIKAYSASQSAIKKIEKAGGKIVLKEVKFSKKE
ncbi:MAG TPA: uL15m family ribosomal protein [Candidatus Paceibacterota bacterium]|nr:uL15m family ribosomal protein [Candidatus Paceibacterota bacterium]